MRLQYINGKFFVDGREVTREEYQHAHESLPSKLHELFGEEVMTDSSAGWPMASESWAVHPAKIAEQMELDKAKGAPLTRYDDLGRQIFESRGHRKAYAKAHGLIDRNSFTGY